MKRYFVPPLLSLLTLATASADFSGSDDFSIESGSWSSTTLNAGRFTLANTRLEYSTLGTPTGNDSFTRTWAANYGSYDSDFTLRIDVFLGTFAMPSNGYANVAFLVQNKSDPSKDFLRLELRRSGTGTRYFGSDSYVNGTYLGAQFISTASTTGTLQFTYTAATHSLSAMFDPDGALNGYSFTPTVSYDIASGPSNWGMTAADSFLVRIVGQSGQSVVSSGDAYFDNFQLVPEPTTAGLLLIGATTFGFRRRARSPRKLAL